MKGLLQVTLTPALIARAHVPGSLAELAEAAGRTVVWKLILAYGGKRIRVPENPAKSKLRQVLGYTGVVKLCDVFRPGEVINVPTGRTPLTNAQAQLMAEAGCKPIQIQQALGLSSSQVRRLIAGVTRPDQRIAEQIDTPEKPQTVCTSCGQRIRRQRRVSKRRLLACTRVATQLSLEEAV